MQTFEVAHIREQGQDMVIVPLKSDFGLRSRETQNRFIHSLQVCARAAGLKGIVVPVWDAGQGRMAFIAPRPWHRFFSSISLESVASNINRRLSCE